MVKPGDLVEPGKAICNYVVTDRNGNRPENNVEDASVEVSVRRITGERFEDAVELPGLAAAAVECMVSAQVGGEIVGRMVEEGQGIKKGDRIACIEKKDYLT
jgi:biotin carboxyl carrier protein